VTHAPDTLMLLR